MGEPEPPIKFVDRRRWAGGADGAAETDVPLRKPSYVEQLELQLAEKDAQLRDVIARYKEAAQEFDAARVRSRRDVVKEIERGKRTILAELLDVLDNLDRAIDAASNNPNIATWSTVSRWSASSFLRGSRDSASPASRHSARDSTRRAMKPPRRCPRRMRASGIAWSV